MDQPGLLTKGRVHSPNSFRAEHLTNIFSLPKDGVGEAMAAERVAAGVGSGAMPRRRARARRESVSLNRRAIAGGCSRGRSPRSCLSLLTP